MNSSDYDMVENRVMDWYDGLNNRNTIDTADMRTRIPPFLKHSDNNGYRYEAENGNTMYFNSEQQRQISELINDEIEKLNKIRNSALNPPQPPSSSYLHGRSSMETMGGKRKKCKKTKRRKSKKSRKSRNKSKRRRG